MSKRRKQKNIASKSIEKKENTVETEQAEEKEIEAKDLTEEQLQEVIEKIIESSNKEYESFGNGGVSKDTKKMIIAICIIVLIVFGATTVLKANKTDKKFKDSSTITAEFDGEAVHLEERTGD